MSPVCIWRPFEGGRSRLRLAAAGRADPPRAARGRMGRVSVSMSLCLWHYGERAARLTCAALPNVPDPCRVRRGMNGYRMLSTERGERGRSRNRRSSVHRGVRAHPQHGVTRARTITPRRTSASWATRQRARALPTGPPTGGTAAARAHSSVTRTTRNDLTDHTGNDRAQTRNKQSSKTLYRREHGGYRA